jgi:glycosyltransferase involved in cell wall biosynthesis
MGVDTSFFRPAHDRRAVREELGWPVDGTVFFSARRLINRVGLLELLRAVRIVRDTYSNVVVKIAGKGPLRGELETTIARLGLDDCVELMGFVSEDDLLRCYQAADVTVLPTQSLEGFGTIISESLACGTPVIVTPIGGMPEAVESLEPQLITRSAASEDIAACMIGVLDGTVPLPSNVACRAYAVERFEWRFVYENVRSVFVRSQS